jgi:hypothetical protein
MRIENLRLKIKSQKNGDQKLRFNKNYKGIKDLGSLGLRF